MPPQSARAQSKIHHESTLPRLPWPPAVSVDEAGLYGVSDEARDAEQTSVSAAREAVRSGMMLDALGRPIDLNVVDRHVKHQNPSASPSEVQTETLEVIRASVSDGLFRLGELSGKPQRFVAWHHSLEHSLQKISHVYVKHYDDPEKWMFSTWLSLTAKGAELARSIEEKDIDGYRRKTP
ncbi:MAG TPA: hypothetical protein VE400_12990 [Mycobacterium sp.]|nr:hypothetical protein [Mycobacterium sp.]